MIKYKWDVYQFVSGFELRSLSLLFFVLLLLLLFETEIEMRERKKRVEIVTIPNDNLSPCSFDAQ